MLILISVAYYYIKRYHGFQIGDVIEYATARSAFEEEQRAFEADASVKAGAGYSGVPVEIPSLLCPTADSLGFKVLAALTLYAADSVALTEIKEKREGVEKLVQFAFSALLPSQIEAERVKERVIELVNGYLKKGRITGVVFTHFDIVPPETK
ncbi:MAG: hypothetical protein JNL74_15135 [Fibrobacteres bacterium]|nr:hypothetical protein [Fibrobacterota bacterium]